MMYWIVFALFMAVETFTDIFISWYGHQFCGLRGGAGSPWPGSLVDLAPLLSQVPFLLRDQDGVCAVAAFALHQGGQHALPKVCPPILVLP